jgi:two-component system, NtrC family, response regulator HydG
METGGEQYSPKENVAMAASTILLVDDDHDTCLSMSDVIADLGYDVDIARDGPAALELIKVHSYRLALLDYKLPGMNGVDLFRHLKQDRAETVGILVTGFAASETIDDAFDAGMRQVMAKPVDFNRLAPIIQEVAGKA